ncbi:LLM class flavin-dependent oxidoreductase [Clavibacter californiensis]|uniref:LLM class flavin-dependent oxidoreductase n=1 Tax=Clavibacter californiensis TaxID=1401995 RepID=A0ABX9N332_9MICO|nr:LLM class flavin-dependent oxidoreductase [Clavibacter californiensis]RII89024.1 LLM class flavin-dependent oxidoreductase [Clavibacter californiensis]UKF81593.1 LLM class flavin-dependent oxidoreductase [Clavibacter californiensis]
MTPASDRTDSRTRAPLSVLNLVPVSAGSSSAEALRDSVDLSVRAEAAGYARYWLAEHHMNPGLAGSSPHAMLAAVAAATRSIRVGSAATLIGNHSALQVAEAFGTVTGLYGPRFDLGLGRSPMPPKQPAGTGAAAPAAPEARVVDGLLVPARALMFRDRSRAQLQARLLRRGATEVAPFDETVDDLLAFLDGTYADPEIGSIAAPPADGSAVEVWIHGSSAGESARVAGSRGLPFGANYHSTPWGVLDAVAAYREHFVPGVLAAPHVIVSADVLVADTDAEARRLASGFARWVLSIRSGRGAIAYPAPDDEAAAPLDVAELAQVQDRLDTRIVGDPATVVQKLETLRRVTGADELLVTTTTHDHAARVRSYELLAEAWGPRGL